MAEHIMTGPSRKSELKPWESALIGVAGVIFLGSAALYVSGFSFRRFFYGDGSSSKEKIGLLSEGSGEIRREMVGDTEFRTLARYGHLFNEDTIFTGSGSTAKLRLDDESVIELGPDTMIKLSFGSSGAFGAITRPATIEVVTGKVTGTAIKREIVIKAEGRQTVLSAGTARKEIVASIPKVLMLPSTPIRAVPRTDSAQPTPGVITPPTTEVPAPVVTPPPPATTLAATTVKLLGPSSGASVTIPKGSVSTVVPVRFKWSVSPAPTQVEFVLRKGGKELKREAVSMASTDGGISVNLDSPGAYEWSVQNISGDASAPQFRSASRFAVEPDFEAIALDDVLIAGQKLSDNRYSGKKPGDFSVTLKWRKFPGTNDYTVVVLDSPNAIKPLLERKTSETELQLNPEESAALRGKPVLYYGVVTPVKNGFIARSPLQQVGYNAIAPVPTSPQNGATFSLATLAKDQGRLLFSWQKTDFTEGYEIELASDEAFSKIFVRRKLRDNFIILKFKNTGKFWWRVRSQFKTAAGPVSAPVTLELTP